MDKLKKARKRMLTVAVVFTVMLVAGIPLIPVGFMFAGKTEGAVHALWLAAAIIGIAFTAVGFYGCPLAWSSYGGYSPILRVVYAVENESLYTVTEIATYLHRSEKDIQDTIRKAIDKLYLEGYFFDGKVLTLNENKKLKRRTAPDKCPNCGAPLPLPVGGETTIKCPYCDTSIQL